MMTSLVFVHQVRRYTEHTKHRHILVICYEHQHSNISHFNWLTVVWHRIYHGELGQAIKFDSNLVCLQNVDSYVDFDSLLCIPVKFIKHLILRIIMHHDADVI